MFDIKSVSGFGLTLRCSAATRGRCRQHGGRTTWGVGEAFKNVSAWIPELWSHLVWVGAQGIGFFVSFCF